MSNEIEIDSEGVSAVNIHESYPSPEPGSGWTGQRPKTIILYEEIFINKEFYWYDHRIKNHYESITSFICPSPGTSKFECSRIILRSKYAFLSNLFLFILT